MAKYSYLSNPQILRYVDNLIVKEQYVKIILFNMNDEPLESIEGFATTGSISVNGQSSMRRTGSLTMLTYTDKDICKNPNFIMNKVTDINNKLSMNKKIEIEVGIKNTGAQYLEYSIFWFPVGVYGITDASVSSNNSGIQISLKFNDKMAFLNGSLGGTFSVKTTHSPIYVEGGDPEPVLNRKLIESLVHDAGGIPKEKIIIEDVPFQIKNAIRWTSNYPAYLKHIDGNKYELTLGQAPNDGAIDEYIFGDAIGYQMTNFTYGAGDSQAELTSNAGETIESVLNKIKNTMGNYEFFFDLDGNFRFREIKNYLNEGSAINNLVDAINDKYFINQSRGKSIYSFDNTNCTVSYSNNPRYSEIKNDIIVWGQTAKNKTPICYHLIIDTPPQSGNEYWVVFQMDADGTQRAKAVWDVQPENDKLSAKKVRTQDWRQELYMQYIRDGVQTPLAKELIQNLPLIYNVQYGIEADNIKPGDNGFFYDNQPDATPYFIDMIDPNLFGGDNIIPILAKKTATVIIPATQSGTEKIPYEGMDSILKLHSIEGEETACITSIEHDANYIIIKYNNTTDTLLSIIINYSVVTGYQTIQSNTIGVTGLESIKQFGVQTIGRRQKVINDSKVNCVFAPVLKDILYVEKAEDASANQKYIIADTSIQSAIGIGVATNSAYDLVRSALHQYTSYNNSISLSCMPIYHLEPNTRITVNDDDSDIHGDYIINSLTVPLTANGTMSISASRAIERI